MEQQKMELWDFDKKDEGLIWEGSGKTEMAATIVTLKDWGKVLE